MTFLIQGRSRKQRVMPSGASGAPEWIPYTPVWLAGGDAVTIGAGTLTGWYADEIDVNARHTTDVQMMIVIGADTSIPAGPWTMGLPDLGVVPFADFVGGFDVFSSGVAVATGIVHVRASSLDAELYMALLGDAVDDSNPITPAEGDYYVFTARYGSEEGGGG